MVFLGTWLALLTQFSAHAAPLLNQTAPEIIAVIPIAPADPMGPYIREAVRRFQVPELWVREVILRESGGSQFAVSSAGAIGLMQVLPGTYARLRNQYGLGPDPRNPHDSILAGASFIRELYVRFGFPGFLAAYNAGPQRFEEFLRGVSALPAETMRYVAFLAPRLYGTATPSGPLSVFLPGWADHQQLPVVVTPQTNVPAHGPQIIRLSAPTMPGSPPTVFAEPSH